MSVWQYESDTPTIDDLVSAYRAYEQQIQDARIAQRAVEQLIDDERAKGRPIYPTPEQVEGFKAAFVVARTGENEGDQFGVSTGGGIAIDGERGWLHVRFSQPWSARHGRPLWEANDEEKQALRDLITEAGFVIVTEWGSPEWISYTIAVRRD